MRAGLALSNRISAKTMTVRVQSERILQEEFLWRLRAYPILPLVTPNGLYIPARTEGERAIKARIISRMKADGMLVPGASDIVLLWGGGAALVETKRPAHKDVFGTHAAGTPSQDQIEFQRRAQRLGINHAYCRSWEQLKAQLGEWGAI